MSIASRALCKASPVRPERVRIASLAAVVICPASFMISPALVLASDMESPFQ